MERFSYPNLAAVEAEDAHLLYHLECEWYGRGRDEQEALEEQRKALEEQLNTDG